MSERDTLERDSRILILPMAAVTINAGRFVVLNASGYAEEGKIGADLIPVGRAEETVDNSTGSAGDVMIKVKQGCFLWNNDTTNPVAKTDIGKKCYLIDSETVSIDNDSNGRSLAGMVHSVEADGVWVKTY
ncbi:hypothetical protein [Vallitalea guaymasensis]|uniref:hypothetical protein n=1 Tax=Vallitalea guaymasensis TaxID=1185412 RepID=UPI000DE40F61|nr:hypothetical protein [Vallitalea guaymasensis]